MDAIAAIATPTPSSLIAVDLNIAPPGYELLEG
jgi:hypothetical protein